MSRNVGRWSSMGASQRPGVEVTYVIPAHILWSGRQSQGRTHLQRKLGDVVLSRVQEEETYLVNSWTVSATPGEVK